MAKKITLTVRVSIAVECYAEMIDDEVTVTSVARVCSPPSASEVMDALDFDGDLQRLDDEYERAK